MTTLREYLLQNSEDSFTITDGEDFSEVGGSVYLRAVLSNRILNQTLPDLTTSLQFVTNTNLFPNLYFEHLHTPLGKDEQTGHASNDLARRDLLVLQAAIAILRAMGDFDACEYLQDACEDITDAFALEGSGS